MTDLSTVLPISTTPYRVIRTRFVGPTDFRGSRIIADAGDSTSRVTLGYDHALARDENHVAGARAVVDKMGWTPAQGQFTALVGGDYDGAYYFVWQPQEARD